MRRHGCHINKRRRWWGLVLWGCGLAAGWAADPKPSPVGWRAEFETMPDEWEVRTKVGVSPATFHILTNGSGVLVMAATNASGTLIGKLEDLDLRQTPVLRWRWRVTAFPTNGDGRAEATDDQAIGIYVSCGSIFSQKSVSYRWETETPTNTEGAIAYGGGLVKVKWICLRNKQSGQTNEFLCEERNVAQDFERLFGHVPEEIGLGISCNSQHSGGRAAAELDWIEFVGAPAQPAKGGAP